MRKRFEKRLVDRMIYAYVDWRDACRAVNDAYRCWTNATRVNAPVAFTRYAQALETEEFSADVYADLVRQVGRMVTSEHDQTRRSYASPPAASGPHARRTAER